MLLDSRMSSTPVAAFDFDRTITIRDTLLPFLLQLLPRRRRVWKLCQMLPLWLKYQMGYIENEAAKEALLTAFLYGYPWAELQERGQQYAQTFLPRWVRPAALQRIQWHQQQGHICVLVSASLDIYLQPWAQHIGFDHVIATRLAINADGQATGKLLEGNCYGPEKAKRLVNLLGDKSNYVLYAYGDSRGDRELLALADYPFYRHMPLPEDITPQ